MNISIPFSAVAVSLFGSFFQVAQAIDIVVDYSYDTNGFFDTPAKREALEAVTGRYSRIITSELAAVSPSGTLSGTPSSWRIGFSHPATGQNFQLSTAASAASDPLAASPADEYGFGGLSANTFVLYAGGRSLSAAGVGGSGTAFNFPSVYNDIFGPYHRGFDDNTPDASQEDLPRWGGVVSFDTGTDWHFDLASSPSGGAADFYSIAMHEVGHALGLNIGWNQWQDNGSGSYLGSEAINAYNLENGTSLTSLDLVSTENLHWDDGTYQSNIFELGEPNLVGTVGLGNGQDLVMEPIANFSSTQNRFELTNVEVGALQDVGWNVIPEPSSSLLFAVGLTFSLRRRR